MLVKIMTPYAVILSTLLVLGCSSGSDTPATGGDTTGGTTTGGTTTGGTTGGTTTGGTTGGETTGGTTGGGETTGGGTTAGIPGGSTADYDGTWGYACEGEEGSYEVYTTVISGNSANSTAYNYTDSDCTIPDDPAVITSTFSFLYPGGTTTTTLGVARHLDVTMTEILIDGVAPDADYMALLNFSGAYDTDYDLILLSGDSLYAGVNTFELDGTSAATRPIVIDEEDILTRQ